MGLKKINMQENGFLKWTIYDKNLFYQYVNKMEGELSSYACFSSLIAWDFYTIAYYKIIENFLCFVFIDFSTDSYIMFPPFGSYKEGNLEEVILEIKKFFDKIKEPIFIFDVKEWMLPYFKKIKKISFKISFDRGMSDYIYQIEDFKEALLKPRERYNKNYFIKYKEPRIEEFTKENIEECKLFLRDIWCSSHKCERCFYGCMEKAFTNFLEYKEEIGLKGFLVRAEEKIVGYIGCSIERNYMVVHIKKNIHSLRGITEFMHEELIMQYADNVKFINYTEDMNQIGLRTHKERIAEFTLSHSYELTESNIGE